MNVRLISIKEKYYTDSYGGEYRAFRIVVYINGKKYAGIVPDSVVEKDLIKLVTDLQLDYSSVFKLHEIKNKKGE